VGVFEKDYESATKLLERAVGSIPPIPTMLWASPTSKWAYSLYNMALALAGKGDYDNAVRTYGEPLSLRREPRIRM
jgi:hypothetical protein